MEPLIPPYQKTTTEKTFVIIEKGRRIKRKFLCESFLGIMVSCNRYMKPQKQQTNRHLFIENPCTRKCMIRYWMSNFTLPYNV